MEISDEAPDYCRHAYRLRRSDAAPRYRCDRLDTSVCSAKERKSGKEERQETGQEEGDANHVKATFRPRVSGAARGAALAERCSARWPKGIRLGLTSTRAPRRLALPCDAPASFSAAAFEAL